MESDPYGGDEVTRTSTQDTWTACADSQTRREAREGARRMPTVSRGDNRREGYPEADEGTRERELSDSDTKKTTRSSYEVPRASKWDIHIRDRYSFDKSSDQVR